MDFITENLNIIAECIKDNRHQTVESDRFELKALHKGFGDSFHETVSAFLNTNGGVVVLGIKENDSKAPYDYTFTKYENTTKNEAYLKYTLPSIFTNKQGKLIPEMEEYIRIELRNFLDGQIAIIYVEELPADLKFAFYKGTAYERILTGDHKITTAEIEENEEIKQTRL